MKKKLSKIDRFRIALKFFMNKEPVTCVCCSKCGSIHVKFIDGVTEGDKYTSLYKCSKCGAEAFNIEQWVRKEQYYDNKSV